MSNARMRARKLHREAMRPARVTNRVVGDEHRNMQVVDFACRDCGYLSCSCAPYEIPKPQPSAESVELAPGWQWRVGSYTHTTNAAVWPVEDGWNYCVPCSDEELKKQFARHKDGSAPTRDEAMALALGWYAADWHDIPEDHVDEDWFAENPRGGTYRVVRTKDTWSAFVEAWSTQTFPSLPHAIAWAMGHDARAATAAGSRRCDLCYQMNGDHAAGCPRARYGCGPACGAVCRDDCPTLRG